MRILLTTVFSVALLLTQWACRSIGPNDTNLQDGGKHPPGWLTTHGVAFQAKQDCSRCHGEPTKNKEGGISKVSCFASSYQGMSCHAAGPVHPEGWKKGSEHGRLALATPGAYGLASCQLCHGNDCAGKHNNKGKNIPSCGKGDVGCHEKNKQGVLIPHLPVRTGKDEKYKPWHSSAHACIARGNEMACAACHKNGKNSPSPAKLPPPKISEKVIEPPTCFNAGLCHGDPFHPNKDKTGKHPDFSDKGAHGPQAKGNLHTCFICHATEQKGAHPRFNVKVTAKTKSCEDCHPMGCAHPQGWLPNYGQSKDKQGNVLANASTHRGVKNTKASCGPCHGEQGQGHLNAPSCMRPPTIEGKDGSVLPVACHVNNPIGARNCTSCHGEYNKNMSPNGANTLEEAKKHNRDGAHTAHKKAGVGCGDCHRGKHADGVVDVVINKAFNFKNDVNGMYDKETKTCMNVSCHGGLKTPGWYEKIFKDGQLDCVKCHTVRDETDPSISYIDCAAYHKVHVSSLNMGCTDCHDMQYGHYSGFKLQKLSKVPKSKDSKEKIISIAGKTVGNNKNKKLPFDYKPREYDGKGKFQQGTCTFSPNGACHQKDVQNGKMPQW